jgi:hypothetical protein
MHLDTEKIQRFVDGQVAPDHALDVRAHLADCDDCRNRVARTRHEEQQLRVSLGHLDHQHETLTAGTFLERAAGRVRRRRAAAGILLMLGAAAAAAMPGSPVRDWLATPSSRSSEPVAPTASPPPAAPAQSGIGLPAGERLVIHFTSVQSAGNANVSFSANDDVVRVSTVAPGVVFDSEAGDRLRIDNAAATADFDIVIPRIAPHVEIWLAGRRVFLKERERVIAESTVRAGGRYTLGLTAR